MSFKTNNDDDDDQDQATSTLAHDGTTMFQFATTTTDHGSTLMEHVPHQPFENSHDEFPNQFSNSEGGGDYLKSGSASSAGGFSFDSGHASSSSRSSFGSGSASSAGGFGAPAAGAGNFGGAPGFNFGGASFGQAMTSLKKVREEQPPQEEEEAADTTAHTLTTSSNQGEHDEHKDTTQSELFNEQNNLINFLLYKGDLSNEAVEKMCHLLPVKQLGLLVSCCRALNEADVTLYVPPSKWNNGYDVRRKFKCLTLTPSTKWVGRINTSNVTEIQLGENESKSSGLVLDRGRVVNDQWLSLMASSKFPQLTSVDLGWCGGVASKMTEIGLIELFNGCPKLTTLNLCKNRHITDMGVVALSKACPQLVSLNLSWCNNITDISFFALSKGCPKLTTLNLEYCDGIMSCSKVRASVIGYISTKEMPLCSVRIAQYNFETGFRGW